MEFYSLYTLSTVLIISLLCYYLYKNGKKLPGPYGFPILGYLPFLRKDLFRQLQELSKKYGKLFQIKIGTGSVLVLNDWTSIKEALINQWDVFSGRPNLFTLRARVNNKEISGQSSSPTWKHQRRFAIKTLRNMGMGKATAETVILQEVEQIIQKFSSYTGKIINSNGLFFPPVINVILNIATGERFEYGSEKAEHFSSVFSKVFDFLAQSNIINIFPILRHCSNSCREYIRNVETIKQHMIRAIDDHKLVYCKENEPKDYIEAYLQQLYSNTDKEVPRKDEIISFSEERLLGDLFNLFTGGAETITNTLTWALLYMAIWPNIQAKVQKEIDDTIGKSKTPQYQDRPLLPYTNAVMLEIQRYTTIVPMAIPHMTKTATNLCGFHIPANVTVWPNFWALHHDPELWGDPEVFRPERFLDADGKVSEPDYFLPFSAGARRCIGEILAKMELFLFFSSLMQKFTFGLPEGHPPPSLEPTIGINLRAKPYSIIIENRN